MSVSAPLLAAAPLAALRTPLQRDSGSKAGSEALDLVGEGATSRGDLAGADRQTRGGATTRTLIRLLVLALPVSEVAAGRALYPLSVNEAIGSVLLSRDADEVRAAIDVRPYAEDGGPDWWVACTGALSLPVVLRLVAAAVDGDEATVVEALLPVVPDLVQRGFLLPGEI
jgi:hypothetical protein